MINLGGKKCTFCKHFRVGWYCLAYPDGLPGGYPYDKPPCIEEGKQPQFELKNPLSADEKIIYEEDYGPIPKQ